MTDAVTADSVYITIASRGMFESDATEKYYDAEVKSAAPDASKITVTNAGVPDLVKVEGAAGDIVKVYSDAGKTNLLGQATVAKNAASATVTIKQLGATSGSVYVTITSTAKGESDATKKDYEAEAASVAPDAGKITVTNNYEIPDTVKVEGAVGDVVKVYSDAAITDLLGQATVVKNSASIMVTVSIDQLGWFSGSIYVTITSKGQGESEVTKKDYDTEATSDAPDADKIFITNNAGLPDTVKVEAAPGDVVKVYSPVDFWNVLGQATVPKGAAAATISIKQLPEGGKIYVSITSTGKSESAWTEKTYADEIESPPLDAADITVTNNAGIPDTVKVDFIDPGDIIKVYADSSSATIWGKATVAQGAASATVSIKQLGSMGGNIYVTLTKNGMIESTRIEKGYAAEVKSVAPMADNITVINNAGIPSTVTVDHLLPGDIIKVYEDSKLAILLGQATVAETSASVTVSFTHNGSVAGNVYVTVTINGLLESDGTEKSYTPR
jgi:hypothetical protein